MKLKNGILDYLPSQDITFDENKPSSKISAKSLEYDKEKLYLHLQVWGYNMLNYLLMYLYTQQ